MYYINNQMKKAPILFFLTIILGFSININAQNTIKWSKDRKLVWSDFKATPDEDIIGYALTSYKIDILPIDIKVDSKNNIKNYQSLTVIANFYTNHSWVHKKSDYLLTHEQLHFDIVGLYAQKIQIEFELLKKQKVANFDTYSDIYDKLWSECRKIQKTFDKESNHGQLVDKNTEWINNIAVKLKKLE